MTSTVLAPGANCVVPGLESITVAIGWNPVTQPNLEVDASAFMLGPQDKVPSDAYFVFYGARTSPEGSVRFNPSATTGTSSDLQSFEIHLGKLPPSVEAVDICLTIHEGQKRGQNFASFHTVVTRLLASDSNSEIARFELPVVGMKETAITLGRVYRRNDQWKFRAIGQGFVGGLAPLAMQYGVDVADEPPPAPKAAPPPPPPPPPAAKPVNLSKVTLEKRGQSVSLEKKRESGFGEIIFNLNWNQPTQAGGLFGKLLGGNKGVDLDLGCLYELENGMRSAIQALGGTMGDYHNEPFIQHAGDDRTGAMSQGENIRINGNQISKIRRILVYAFIYEGVPNWAAANGVATVKIPDQPDIEVHLDNPTAGQIMCAIALIEINRGTLKVTKEERYFSGHRQMDDAYNWQLKWVAGSK